MLDGKDFAAAVDALAPPQHRLHGWCRRAGGARAQLGHLARGGRGRSKRQQDGRRQQEQPKKTPIEERGRAIRSQQQATTERDTISAKLIAEASSASSNHETLAKLSEQLAHAQTKVDAAEESWLNFAAEAESRGIDMS